MLLYVDSNDNSNKKKIFKVQDLRFEAFNDILDTNEREDWTPAREVSSFYITKAEPCDSEGFHKFTHDLPIETDTSYVPSAANSYVLIRKADITKISAGSGSLGLYRSFGKAAMTVNASGCTAADIRLVK